MPKNAQYLKPYKTYLLLYFSVTGRLCEYLTSLTFNYNDSLVELEPLRTAPQANVTLGNFIN